MISAFLFFLRARFSMRVLSLGVAAFVLSLVSACDKPPDLHVYVYSDISSPAEAVIWRVRRGYRLKPRQIQPLERNTWRTYASTREHFRIEPLGELPANEWIRIDLERHQPHYRTTNRLRTRVLTRFRPGHHLRLDVWFRPPGGICSGGVGGVGGVGVERCAAYVPGCRGPTPEEIRAANGPPSQPIHQGDVDEDETPWRGDPPDQPETIPSCIFICDQLPDDDNSEQPRDPPPDLVPVRDASVDAEVDATADVASDTGIFLGEMPPPPAPRTACNGADNDCDGVIDDGPCPDGVCIGNHCRNYCVEGTCFPNQVCTASGLCEETACVGVTCPAERDCVAGGCVDLCGIVTCGTGQICRHGRCFDPCP